MMTEAATAASGRPLQHSLNLAEGRFRVDGRPVALRDIRVPVFAVATERDHVAPWHSVFKLHLLTDAELNFVLMNGGHNAGIVSEPGHPRRHYRTSLREPGEPYVDPDAWFAEHTPHEGSWWSAWTKWLAAHSGKPVPPLPLGNAAAGFAALEDAPDSYVSMRRRAGQLCLNEMSTPALGRGLPVGTNCSMAQLAVGDDAHRVGQCLTMPEALRKVTKWLCGLMAAGRHARSRPIGDPVPAFCRRLR